MSRKKGLGLSLGLDLGGIAGGASGPDPARLQSITTESSTNPTTTAITLASGQNAVRVFTGEQLASEPFFYLYVKKNGGSVDKIKMYRWQGRIINGAAGDVFAFGTSNGRALQMAAMAAPAVLTSPSAVTANANCDQALPIIWAPAAAHVTFAAANSVLVLEADGTERFVFISEKDPTTGLWTPPRWIRHSATRDTAVQCNYTEVAIANEAGVALSITGPAGTTIGGTKTTMSLPMPAITGTSRVCTTGAQFASAIAAAIPGDEIVVSGTITLTADVTRASFVANEALGNKGYEGILIRGLTAGDRTSGIVLSGGFGWQVNMPGAGATMTGHGYQKDLTWDFGANTRLFSHGGGKYRTQNVRTTGGTTDAWDVNATNYPVIFDALFCTSDISGSDCWNFSGNATYNAASRIRLIGCEGLTAGSATDAQCLTSHLGLPFEVYGGLYSDANTSVIANDAVTTPGYVFFSSITKGTRAAGITNGIELFGCKWDDGIAGSNPITTRFSRLTTTIGSTSSLLRNAAVAEHNIIVVTGGRAIFNSLGGGSLFGNIITANEAIRLGSAAGAVASTNVLFNTLIGNNIGFSSQDVSNMPSVFKNNGAATNTTSINVVAGGGAAITGDYNTADNTVSANYTPGVNDQMGVQAAIDATTFLPTVAGNCDGSGDPTLIDFIGDSDPFGFVQFYKSTRASRGARDVPALHSAAVLYPDLF